MNDFKVNERRRNKNSPNFLISTRNEHAHSRKIKRRGCNVRSHKIYSLSRGVCVCEGVRVRARVYRRPWRHSYSRLSHGTTKLNLKNHRSVHLPNESFVTCRFPLSSFPLVAHFPPSPSSFSPSSYLFSFFNLTKPPTRLVLFAPRSEKSQLRPIYFTNLPLWGLPPELTISKGVKRLRFKQTRTTSRWTNDSLKF